VLESLLGIRMTLLLGPTIAVPAPAPVVQALAGVEVTLRQQGRSGCQLTFTLGRGPREILDYTLAALPLLWPMSRVVLQVWMGVLPEVLFDGFITHRQVLPGSNPGEARMVLSAEDVRVMMDLHEISMPWPALTHDARVNAILPKYLLYFAQPPLVLPMIPPSVRPPTECIPLQSGTDLSYVEALAKDAGHVFYVEPGVLPNTNTVYWGPENRAGKPQKALSANMGAQTNLEQISFSYDAMMPRVVLGSVQDARLGVILPVVGTPPVQVPLALVPAMLAQLPNVRTVLMQDGGNLDLPAALARAQAVGKLYGNPVTAEGELDALRYGALLRANRLVGLRGAGATHDGFWFVKEVTHRIAKGSYRQAFSLHREGFGPLGPVVPPQ
jgi:hypothetical protein